MAYLLESEITKEVKINTTEGEDGEEGKGGEGWGYLVFTVDVSDVMQASKVAHLSGPIFCVTGMGGTFCLLASIVTFIAGDGHESLFLTYLIPWQAIRSTPT